MAIVARITNGPFDRKNHTDSSGSTFSLLMNTPDISFGWGNGERGNNFAVECNYCDSFDGFCSRKEQVPVVMQIWGLKLSSWTRETFKGCLKVKCLLVCLRFNCIEEYSSNIYLFVFLKFLYSNLFKNRFDISFYRCIFLRLTRIFWKLLAF